MKLEQISACWFVYAVICGHPCLRIYLSASCLGVPLLVCLVMLCFAYSNLSTYLQCFLSSVHLLLWLFLSESVCLSTNQCNFSMSRSLCMRLPVSCVSLPTLVQFSKRSG